MQDSIYYYYGSLDVLVSLLDSTDVAMQEMATRALGSLASLNHRSWQYLIHGVRISIPFTSPAKSAKGHFSDSGAQHKAKVYHQIQDFLDAEQGANDGLQGAACLAIAYFVENEAPLQHVRPDPASLSIFFFFLSGRPPHWFTGGHRLGCYSPPVPAPVVALRARAGGRVQGYRSSCRWCWQSCS